MTRKTKEPKVFENFSIFNSTLIDLALDLESINAKKEEGGKNTPDSVLDQLKPSSSSSHSLLRTLSDSVLNTNYR